MSEGVLVCVIFFWLLLSSLSSSVALFFDGSQVYFIYVIVCEIYVLDGDLFRIAL